jgi:hypothetical protein
MGLAAIDLMRCARRWVGPGILRSGWNIPPRTGVYGFGSPRRMMSGLAIQTSREGKKMARIQRYVRAMLFVLAAAATNAWASFHIVQIDQIFSDASGNVQYIRLAALAGGQQFLAGQNIVASQGQSSKTYAFTTDLPGDTTGKKFLIATQGFAALNIVTPDYVVPNGFLFRPGGTINYAGSSDIVTYAALPSDGTRAIDRNGTVVVAAPVNFAGQTGQVNIAPVQAGPHGHRFGRQGRRADRWVVVAAICVRTARSGVDQRRDRAGSDTEHGGADRGVSGHLLSRRPG